MLERLGSISARALLLALAMGLCSAQSLPVSSDAAATVVTLIGQVSIVRDSQPWALEAGGQIKPGQLVSTGQDGYALFQVSDGSTFEVFPNSRVIFRDNPGNWKDLLEMIVGRIKVHIQKWGGQPNHNRVRTPTAIISVRGTIFDITVEDSDSTLVLVEEGQVAVEHRYLPSGQKLLNPGEWLRVYRSQPLAQKSLDKGSALRIALASIRDAVINTVNTGPHSGPGASPPGSPAPPSGGTGPSQTPGEPKPPASGGSSGGTGGDAGPGAPPPPPPKH